MALAGSEFARIGEPPQMTDPGMDAGPVRAAVLEARHRAELVSARDDEIEELRATVRRLDSELRTILHSASWRLTGPLRGLAQRHPQTIARARAALRKHGWLARALLTVVRIGRRTATFRSPSLPAPAVEDLPTQQKAGVREVHPEKAPAPPPLAPRPQVATALPVAAQIDAPADNRPYDVVAVLNQDDAAWAKSTGLRHAAGQVTVIGPGSSSPALAAWWRAVAEARQSRRHLLMLFAPLLVGAETVPLLLAELERDPMLGTAQPRFADEHTDALWPLPPASTDHAPMPCACLRLLPATVVTAELLSACILVRREVVAAMEGPVEVETVLGAISNELTRARRRGFRNVVVNAAVVPSTLAPAALYPAPPAEDAARLDAAYPERAWAREDNQDLLERTLEPLLAAAYPGRGKRRALLVDCRGLDVIHNGTSQCILGILDGLAALNPNWTVHVQSTPETAAFHKLPTRYGAFVHHTGPVIGRHAAVLLPNQPWSLDRIAELHRLALVIGCNMLDTISWDILYAGPRKLDRTWRFAARHMDVVSFISAYSRERFRRRFDLAPSVHEAVVPLSLAAAEQRMEGLPGLPDGDHVLLFGNAFEHKAIAPTIRLLSAAFPRQRFVVLGGREASGGSVEVIAGGSAKPEEVHRLVATARALVFPSFYEGFGLPVLEGLAYGRPVLVRRSALWAEIAASSRFDAPLIEFEDGPGLIAALGGVLAGAALSSLPFGTALATGEQPRGWKETAAGLLDLFETRLAAPDLQHWRDRAESLRLAGF